jgi:hypothetical protein
LHALPWLLQPFFLGDRSRLVDGARSDLEQRHRQPQKPFRRLTPGFSDGAGGVMVGGTAWNMPKA